jgi:chromosome segregation ATPase
MDISIKGTNKQIEEYDRRIAEEARRMEVHTQAKREETNRKLEIARSDVEIAEKRTKSLQEQHHTKQVECDAAQKEGQAAENTMKSAQQKITESSTMIKQCQQHAQNTLNPYGKDIKGLLDQIVKTHWQGDVPLGPLGMYVKVKDINMWAELLRAQMSKFLTAFAVTDVRDRTKLKDMLVRSGKCVFPSLVFVLPHWADNFLI